MSLDTIASLDTHVCIYNPYWQSSGIIIIFCKYYIVFSDIMIGSWMYFSCCSSWESKKKRLSCRKSTQKNLCEGHHFFCCTPSFICHFLSSFSSTTPLSLSPILRRKKNFTPENDGELAPAVPLSPLTVYGPNIPYKVCKGNY